MEILAYKPKYLEFLIEEGDRGHLGRKKFPEWAKYKNVGIASDEETGSVERRGRAKNMPTAGG